MNRYTIHTDPGHGWAEVSVAEIERLGIAAEITDYSYLSLDRKTAYLEEDCDLSTWARAKRAAGEAFELVEAWRANTFVRNLPHYQGGRPSRYSRRAS